MAVLFEKNLNVVALFGSLNKVSLNAVWFVKLSPPQPLTFHDTVCPQSNFGLGCLWVCV